MARRLSPFLRSSIEFLQHGLWHLDRSDAALDMKFAILHVDQAVELILKEKVRDLGESVFKKPKETIGIAKAYEILNEKKVKIPEKNNLELLHEERNSIQHTYSNPSPDDTLFLIEHALIFILRFSKKELDVDFNEYIPARFINKK